MIAAPAVGVLAVGFAAYYGLRLRKDMHVKAMRAKPSSEWVSAFVPWEGTSTDADWAGALVDLYSPDYMSAERKPWDTNPRSRRFVDLNGGELQVSEDTADGYQSGRRFFPDTAANPTLKPIAGVPNARSMSFKSKIPPDAPPYKDAQNGALDFTGELGTAFGRKVIKLNTLYNGKGGPFVGFVAPPGEYNFWVYV